MSMERIINECQPAEDEIDKRILYELTGLKLNQGDFADETESLDADLGDLLEDIMQGLLAGSQDA